MQEIMIVQSTKRLPWNYEDSSLNATLKIWVWCHPSLGRPSQTDPWSSLANQPTLIIDKLQAK